jgi:hypothetical protein
VPIHSFYTRKTNEKNATYNKSIIPTSAMSISFRGHKEENIGGN